MEGPADFALGVEQRTIIVSGEVDAHTAPELSAAIASVGPPLEIDARGVSFIDSSGLSALLAAVRLTEESDTGRVVLVASDAVRRLVVLTGLEFAFDLRS